ncbi:Protein TSSC1 [Histomonas meleagridis]|uniref:Protein TSSC1 n=1 Tax=Histomonas meleagridis TaxID=135588 RepID=UPI0035599CB4|nr:Protein TSSC1 [Histomonas meleagridis]KAH0805914.1 Protein TSSC1 [Histomonas meleagridis]
MTKYEAVVSSYAGMKSCCRHISAIPSISDKTMFAVGSAIVGKSNQIQILEYNEIKASIQCTQTLDYPDEIWWIECHPTESNIFSIISSKPREKNANICKIPSSSPGGSSTHQETEILTTFTLTDPTPQRIFYLPSDSKKCVISTNTTINLFDIEDPTKSISTITDNEIKGTSIDQIHEGIVAGCCGSSIKLWDLRAGSVVHQIDNAHSPTALDVSFNDNKQWWICTGGYDGYIRCWDSRVGKAECEFRASSHWVTRTIPSVSHEQLILTAGTDSKVRIFNSSVFAFQNEGQLPDGEIIKSIRHDDSVYCATWASNNPWIFASVSYKGQVNICQLPSQVVDSILIGEDDLSL